MRVPKRLPTCTASLHGTPVMKAIGVREFAAALAGEVTLAAATEQAKAATRRYAKRQATWLRHQLGPGWRLAKT